MIKKKVRFFDGNDLIKMSNSLELLKKEKNDDIKNFKNKISGRTLLHYAILNCNFSIIRYLIETVKVNINELDNNNFNALLLASLQNCDVEIVKYLIDNGIKLKQKDNILNRNALMIAINSNSIKIVEYLLSLPLFDINEKDANNDDCITIAIKSSNLIVLDKLLKHAKQDYIFEQIIYYLHYNYPNRNKAIITLLKHIQEKKFAIYKYTILEHVVFKLNYEIFRTLIYLNIIDINDPKIRDIGIVKDLKENTEAKIINAKFMERQKFTTEEMYNILGIYNKLFP